MKKLIFLLCFFFATAFMPNPARSQQGQAVLKIVKSDDGTIKIYDMQGHEINQANPTAVDAATAQKISVQTGNETDARFKNSKAFNGPIEPEKMMETRISTRRAETEYKPNEDKARINAIPAVPETNSDKHVNNTTATVLNPGPDLTFDFSKTSADYGYPYLSLYSWIVNNGSASSVDCILRYYLDDVVLSEKGVPSLSPGGWFSDQVKFDMSGYPGTWNIFTIIDYTDVVAEDDESNNVALTHFTIDTNGPNLTAAGWNINYFDRRVDIYVDIINNGAETAGSSVLGFYLSDDRSYSANDPILGDVPVFSLPPGSQSGKSFTVSNGCNYVDTGQWYVGFLIDETNAVAELNENDNEFFPHVYYFTCPVPNLTTQRRPNSFQYDTATRQLEISVRVINDGAAPAGSSTLGYYLSADTDISSGDRKLGTDDVPSLNISSYSDERIAISDVCNYVKAGTWHAGYIIDETDAVTESDETDNTYSFSAFSVNYHLTIDVNPPGSGNVSRDPDKTNYDNNESVQLTANAAPGYQFDYWSGDLSGNNNPAELVMDGDKSICAFFVSNAYTNPYQVTNTNDSGPGSLRQALANAALNPDPVPIVFGIPKSDPGYRNDDDVWTIKPTMVYRIDRRYLTIDGASQARYLGLPKNAPPKIELDGSSAPDGYGISFSADDCGLNGLIINNFANAGISFSYLDQGYVYNCYIGTDATGRMARGNGTGIQIIHASNITVAPIDSIVRGSIISGNTTGIFLSDSSYKAIISGNIIGSDRSITKKLGNSGHGICLQNSCAEVVIAQNVLVDNGYGIYDQSGFKNTIVLNYIGTDTLNGTDMGNKNDGIYIGSTMDMCFMNTIAYNRGYGLLLMGDSHTSNTISKNSIYRNHAGGIDIRYGANCEITPPQIHSITSNSVSGLTGADQFVEVFADSSDQGRYFWGTTKADQDGKFMLHLDEWPYNLQVTATTRDEFGNTSKFSTPCVISNVANTEDHPEKFIVSQTYPNPFNTSAVLQITLSSEQYTTVQIFNFRGQKVRDLLSQKLQQGTHQINWQGTDDAGKPLASGIYFILCKIGTFQECRKAVLLK
jgi:hypothetical protein